MADADLVIEAVFEDKQVKSDLFKKLDLLCTQKTILATNTSSFFVREFADQTSRPDRFIGLHYFYHPAKNRLLEVIPHEGTSTERFMQLFRSMDGGATWCSYGNPFQGPYGGMQAIYQMCEVASGVVLAACQPDSTILRWPVETLR